MMCAAAICVNKGIFGHDFEKAALPEEENLIPTDSVTRNSDGSVTVHTRALTDAQGYAGPVPLDITIDGKGTVTSVTPLENAETPSFFNRASELFGGWVGKNAADVNPMQTDAISGATYSSEAIKTNMEVGLACYLHSTADNGGSIPWKMWVAFAVALAACIIPVFVHNKIYTNVQLIANIIVLGFWCGQFLDYTLMLKYLTSGISLPVGLTAIVMLFAAFVMPLLGRPQHYCNHICPLGSAQILVGQFAHRKINMSKGLVKGLEWFRRILWAVLMLALWADIYVTWMDYELFQAFIIESAPIGIIIAALIFIILSIFIPRPYCRFVCPTGSLFKAAENI